jgi:hypothetical protein
MYKYPMYKLPMYKHDGCGLSICKTSNVGGRRRIGRPSALARQPVPPITRSPTICTAMTFTMVIDGKIIA